MKILLRSTYEWKDAIYKDNWFVINDTVNVGSDDIVSILDDNRPIRVKCSVCGKVFKKGSKEWKEHIRPNTDNAKCWDCRYKRENRDFNIRLDKKYTKREDGKYTITSTGVYDLICSYRYPSRNLNEALSTCFYNQCIDAKADEFKDFFQTYPGAFDDIITEDKVLGFGYKSKWYNGAATCYELKARNKIEVCVNKFGIVDHINIAYNRRSDRAYYSKKYNKLFIEDRNTGYSATDFSGWIPQASVELILKKLAALYS